MPPLLRFARYREIAREIATLLASGSGEEVIVASGGLASSATAELLRQTPSHATSVRLSTLESFARRLLNDGGDYPRIATDSERRLSMRIASSSIDDPMMETRGIVLMLERSYRDVRDSGMTLVEFERRTREATALRNGRRTEMIIRTWRAYEQLIGQLQAVDPADVLTRAARIIEEERVPIAPQIVAGFYDMTGGQLRLLSALRAAGKLARLLVPIGEGDAYAFASRFVKQVDVGRASARLDGLKPVPHIAQYENKEAELRAVCSSVRELLDRGTPPNAIGIVTRSLDPDDVRLLERFAGELGFTISEHVEVPLLAHRLGRGIDAILRLRERNFPRSDVIDILRDGFQPRSRVNVDRIDVATRQSRVSGGRSKEIWNPAGDPLIEDFRAVVAELESLTGLPEIAQRFRLDTQLDLNAAAAIDEIAALLRRVKGWRFDAGTVIDLLEQISIPRPPTTDNRQPVVWLGDVMTFRGRTFEHLFAIRMQEGSFPQRRVDDPLLPDSDRRQLGIRDIGDGRDEERLLFQLLLDGAATSIHFSLAGSDGFGKVLRPSQLLKQFAVALHTGRRPEILRDFSRAFPGKPVDNPTTRQLDNLPRQLQLIVRSGTRSVFDGYLFAQSDDESLRSLISDALQSISPTQLEDYGECPQKFLFKHILGVIDYDDPERELQMHHREKGKLDHAVLEAFYRSIDEAALLRARRFLPQLAPELRDRIDAVIDAAFDDDEARVPPFNRVMRQIERRATKRNLHAFLAADLADLLASDLRPAHFEYKFGAKYAKRGTVDHPEPFSLTARDVPIRVEGSIDRIDRAQTRMRIVDYKSGKALRHVNLAEKIDRGVRLQLPLYAIAVSAFFNVNPASIGGAIKPLVVRGVDGEKLTFELGHIEARLRQTLDLFVTSMLRGAFPAFPSDRDEEFNSCKYCPVNHSCRTRHAEAERRAVVRQKDPRTLLQNLAAGVSPAAGRPRTAAPTQESSS